MDGALISGLSAVLARPRSGDGTLAVYDPRYNKAVAVSDQLEDELLSVAVVKVGATCRIACPRRGRVL